MSKKSVKCRVYVTGSDLLDGTPIIDIKPYIQYSDAVPEAQSGYAQDEPSRKSVMWSKDAEQQKIIIRKGTISAQLLEELEAVLSLDPRPAYQDDENRVYGMKFADLDVKFKVTLADIVVDQLIL